MVPEFSQELGSVDVSKLLAPLEKGKGKKGDDPELEERLERLQVTTLGAVSYLSKFPVEELFTTEKLLCPQLFRMFKVCMHAFDSGGSM